MDKDIDNSGNSLILINYIRDTCTRYRKTPKVNICTISKILVNYPGAASKQILEVNKEFEWILNPFTSSEQCDLNFQSNLHKLNPLEDLANPTHERLAKEIIQNQKGVVKDEDKKSMRQNSSESMSDLSEIDNDLFRYYAI